MRAGSPQHRQPGPSERIPRLTLKSGRARGRERRGKVRVAHALGRFGEQVAADHLQQAGLEILARNWRCPQGELDIVAWDPQERCVVFCEVKTRTGTAFGSPAEAVTPIKARRLRRLAAAWLQEPGSRHGDIRFDIVEVVRDRRAPLQVNHLVQVI